MDRGNHTRLIGIYFWWEGLEGAFGPERRGEKGGLGGKEGRSRWFGVAVVWISAEKVPDPRPILLEPGGFSAVFIAEERRFPARVAKVFFGSGVSGAGRQVSCLSAVVEDESPAVVERNLFGLPGGALVQCL